MGSTDTFDFTYHFCCARDKDRDYTFHILLDGDGLDQVREAPEALPEWTRLEYAQCAGCPLSQEECPHCPAAVSLLDIAELCGEMLSFDEVDVTVTSSERVTKTTTSAQKVACPP